METSKKYEELNKTIIDLEKRLLGIAPEEVKRLYLQIDFLCQKQKNIELELAKNN